MKFASRVAMLRYGLYGFLITEKGQSIQDPFNTTLKKKMAVNESSQFVLTDFLFV